MERIIAIILWCIICMVTMIEYAPACKDLSIPDQLIVIFIFIIGGPIFAAANILEAILNCILPEDWDDDDRF